MAKADLKSVEAIHNGKKIGTFEARKGVVKIIVPEYEYWFDFTIAGKRYRSVFGKESDFGRIGATGRWQSHAVESAVEVSFSLLPAKSLQILTRNSWLPCRSKAGHDRELG